MTEVLAAFFSLLETTLTFVSDDKRNALSDDIYSLKNKIKSEQLKPVDQQDHAQLEKWYQEIPLVVERFQNALALEAVRLSTTRK